MSQNNKLFYMCFWRDIFAQSPNAGHDFSPLPALKTLACLIRRIPIRATYATDVASVRSGDSGTKVQGAKYENETDPRFGSSE